MLIPKFVPKNLDAQIVEMNATSPGAKRGTPQPAVKKARPLSESAIEKQLVKRVKELGGLVRKVEFIGHRGAPDRLVMLPALIGSLITAGDCHSPAQTIWVELKAPGKKAEPHQAREHERMRKMGQRVEVVDSFERIEEILK